jgi:hypothetical protein
VLFAEVALEQNVIIFFLPHAAVLYALWGWSHMVCKISRVPNWHLKVSVTIKMKMTSKHQRQPRVRLSEVKGLCGPMTQKIGFIVVVLDCSRQNETP